MKNCNGFIFKIGTFFEGYTLYHVVKDNKSYRELKSDNFDKEYLIGLTEENYNSFLEEINNCNILSWDEKYVNRDVLDDEEWELTIYSKDKEISSSGLNEYPSNWEDFLNVLKKYQIIE